MGLFLFELRTIFQLFVYISDLRWETKRSRTLNHNEWLAIRLGYKGLIKYIEVDTRHFKGNFPDFFKLGTSLQPKEIIA